MNVMLIDDDPEFSAHVIEELLRHGNRVAYYDSFLEAMDAIEKETYDLFIIDLMLPPSFQSEGLDILKYVKANTPSSEVCMISSKNERMTRIVDRAYQLGARRFLDKDDVNFIAKLVLIVKEIKKEMNNSIFISHGHAELLKYQLKDFVREKLGKTALILSELPNNGLTIVEKLEAVSEKCCKAIILLTKDDEMADGSMRSRQNVIHEIGFFQGKYGRKNVILLCEEGVELFTNISGIVYIQFDRNHFAEVFEQLRNEMI